MCSPLCRSRVLLWGPVAVEHHKTCRSLGKSLWQQPSVGDILRLLDRDRMMKTILHFPQNRRLLPPEVQGGPQGRAVGERSRQPWVPLCLPGSCECRCACSFEELLAPSILAHCTSCDMPALFLLGFVNIKLSKIPTVCKATKTGPPLARHSASTVMSAGCAYFICNFPRKKG